MLGIGDKNTLPVLLDGQVIGRVLVSLAKRFVLVLRSLKVKGHAFVPRKMEICAVYDWKVCYVCIPYCPSHSH